MKCTKMFFGRSSRFYSVHLGGRYGNHFAIKSEKYERNQSELF
jgi:hypothetical protein